MCKSLFILDEVIEKLTNSLIKEREDSQTQSYDTLVEAWIHDIYGGRTDNL